MALVLVGCAGLPPMPERTASSVIRDTASTTLGRAVATQLQANPGRNGIHRLANPVDSLTARLSVMAAAERTLDLQYYIWHDDLTGGLMFEAVRAAAARGVRVRLLLDDNNTEGLDETLALLDAQPNVEVRLFNPFATRSVRWVSYLTDFSRTNRRMHNKSLTADDQVTIIGGRNIGDEYFGAGDGLLFADLDVIAVGSVVDDVSTDFDRYWSAAPAYPVSRILPPAAPDGLARFEANRKRNEARPEAATYLNALRDSPLPVQLRGGTLDLTWAAARMVSDDPAKVLGRRLDDRSPVAQLRDVIGDAEHELEIVSPYFVPTEGGVAELTAMARRGVRIAILTNSLEATDVAAVHAGYAKWRKSLLQAGIQLFEERRQPGDPERQRRAGSRGPSSSASLHAKTFAVDQRRIFVGSFNFDPRSARLNTELGFIIESAVLAQGVAEAFQRVVPERAYEVRLDSAGELEWVERRGDQILVHRQEPGVGTLKRAWVGLLSHLPIEGLL